MAKKLAGMVGFLVLLRLCYIGGQAVTFYDGDVRIPLLVGKQRVEAEELLGKPIQQWRLPEGTTCIYDFQNISVRVRFSNTDKVVFLENPDFAD